MVGRLYSASIWLGALGSLAVTACVPGGLPLPAPVPDSGASDAGAAPPPGSDSTVSIPDAGPPSDSGPPVVVEDYIWAIGNGYLYRIDPTDLSGTWIGPLIWPPGTPELNYFIGMLDLALDDKGTLFGVAVEHYLGIHYEDWGPCRLYTVDPTTAACTFVADIEPALNGLAFVPLDATDPESPKILLGVGYSLSLGPPKAIYEVDPVTGSTVELALLYDPLLGVFDKTGDVAAVPGVGIFLTARVQSGAVPSPFPWDYLLSFDPQAGTSTVVGEITAEINVRGLAAWNGMLFGFNGRPILTLDLTDGSPLAETICCSSNGISFYGAASAY